MFPSFLQAYSAQIRASFGEKSVHDFQAPTARAADEYGNIRESFSKEWSMFDYNRDKTWGWTLDERKQVFLKDIQLDAGALGGMRLLDAGCGNGTLSAALTDFGLTVVGLDLNDGLGLAYLNRSRYGQAAAERVQYVQGNLIAPPFRDATYDLVYSSGVIHHTPSSKDSFTSLSRMVRPGGRLYVWIYGKRAFPVRIFFATGRSLKRFISLHSLMKVCKAIAPLYKVIASALNALRLVPFRARTTREITLDLFDAFAPRYNHWHTEDEVASWFRSAGFTNITLSGVQKHGFGMHGDKARDNANATSPTQQTAVPS